MAGTVMGSIARRPAAAPWRAEAAATLALAWPLALTNLSQHAMTVTDSLILGWFSTEALAAATLGANLYWMLMAPALGVGLAAAPMLAQARGRGQRAGGGARGWVAEMGRAARGVTVGALLVLLPCLALLWQGEAVLRLLGQEDHLAALAGTYLRTLMWGLLPFTGFVVLRGFLAAMERPGRALAVALGGVLLNAALCPLLVFGIGGLPGLGMVGAGLASTLGNGFMLVALIWLIARDRVLRRFRLLAGAWIAGARLLAEVMRLGLPIAGSLLLEIGVFSAAAFAIGPFGAVAVAAHAIALQTSALTFMVPMGIGQAATARVGLLAGAGEDAGARRAGWTAIALGAGFMAAMALLLILGREAIAHAFLDPADPDTPAAAALGAALLLVAGVYQLADGVQAVAAGALRGLKDTRVPMLLAAFGYWGAGLPLGLLLAHPLKLGPEGIWVGLAVGLGTVAVPMLLRWRVLAAGAARRAAGATKGEMVR